MAFLRSLTATLLISLCLFTRDGGSLVSAPGSSGSGSSGSSGSSGGSSSSTTTTTDEDTVLIQKGVDFVITDKGNPRACHVYEKLGGKNDYEDEIVYVYDYEEKNNGC